MDSIYLSPAHVRVPLSKESDVHAVLDAGLLEESHFLDLKREVKQGKAQNKETARDLAQFAIDGGTVVVGIDELGDGTLDLCPQSLDGLAERIEQIATMNVDPPLAVIARPIPTEADRAVGYLVIHIPASPTAPHMVDGRYIARGDKTKRYLTDPEVMRLHALRSASELNVLNLLQREIERDIFGDVPVGNAHGFFVAQPMTGRPDMLLPLTDGPNYHQSVLDLRENAYQRSQALVGRALRGGFSPDLRDLNTFERRPAGVAQTSYAIGPGRQKREEQGYESRESAAELELLDSGGVHIYSSRLSWTNPEGSRLLMEAAVVGLAHRLVALAGGVAERSGYFGSWALAFGATRTRGTYSALQAEGWDSSSPYPDETYERATTATYADLTQRPRELVDQLVGSMLRGFGVRQAFMAALAAPPGDARERDCGKISGHM